MGADLYVKDLPREPQCTGFEVSKKAVDIGYFRDCYNDSGLFPFINANTTHSLSWWRLRDRKEWFEKKGDEEEMTVKGAKEFLGIIKDAKRQIEGRTSLREQTYNSVKSKTLGIEAYDNRKLTKKEITWYKTWLDLLIKFLELAIKENSNILWSV